MLKKSLLWLLIILVLASLIRVYKLDKVPASLFGDEVDVGYQAYSLLKTGQDLQGNSWPILIHSLSEYRVPLFIYSDMPFVAIFGLNEWGVRLAAVFWGILGILGVYLLVRKLFNERIGLLTAGFLAISPWHIQYSRAGFEATMLLTFLIFATYFFLRGLEKKYFLIVSAILFGLTPYIYSTAVVFMPLLIGLLIFNNRQSIRRSSKSSLLAVVVFVLIFIPYSLQTISGSAGGRFNLISIFANKDLQEKVTLLQQREQFPLEMQRFFHNKPTVILQNFSMNYLRAFSPEFLFLQGDPNFRHSIHEMGEMYFYEIILLLLGVWIILKSNTNRIKFLVLGWLLVSPIPASLTYDGGFHATRDFLMLPALIILVSLGANFIWENIKDKNFKYLAVILITLAVFNFTFYLHRNFIDYPLESWRAWHFGFKEAMQYVDKNSLSFDKVLINNTYEPSLIRFLFWSEYDPDKFHKNFKGDKPQENITDGFNGFSLEDERDSSSNKYYFGKINGPYEGLINDKTLFVASALNDITNPDTLNDKRVKLLETIYSPTGEAIFYLITGAGSE